VYLIDDIDESDFLVLKTADRFDSPTLQGGIDRGNIKHDD
jgi:hypothetical protein